MFFTHIAYLFIQNTATSVPIITKMTIVTETPTTTPGNQTFYLSPNI